MTWYHNGEEIGSDWNMMFWACEHMSTPGDSFGSEIESMIKAWIDDTTYSSEIYDMCIHGRYDRQTFIYDWLNAVKCDEDEQEKLVELGITYAEARE